MSRFPRNRPTPLFIFRSRSAMIAGLGLAAAFALGRASSEVIPAEPRGEIVSLPSVLARHTLDPKAAFEALPVAAGHDASVALVRTTKELRAHYHEERDEVAYVLRGGGTLLLNGRRRAVKAGDLIYIPRGVVHGFTNGGRTETVVISVMAPPFDGKDRHFVDRVEAKPVTPD